MENKEPKIILKKSKKYSESQFVKISESKIPVITIEEPVRVIRKKEKIKSTPIHSHND